MLHFYKPVLQAKQIYVAYKEAVPDTTIEASGIRRLVDT